MNHLIFLQAEFAVNRPVPKEHWRQGERTLIDLIPSRSSAALECMLSSRRLQFRQWMDVPLNALRAAQPRNLQVVIGLNPHP